MTSRTLARRIASFAVGKKASEVVLLDLRKYDAPADFFVLCTAESSPQVKAIADEIEERTERLGVRLWHSEGRRAMSWLLLDFVDVVVHVFLRDVRRFYNLERLWADVPRIEVEDSGKGIVFHDTEVRTRKPAPRTARRKPAKMK